MKEQLVYDMANMENGMIRTGAHSDIWQDRLIWAICKAVYDILKILVKRELF